MAETPSPNTAPEVDSGKFVITHQQYIEDKVNREMALFHRYLRWVSGLILLSLTIFGINFVYVMNTMKEEVRKRTDDEFRSERIRAIVDSAAQQYTMEKVDTIVVGKLDPMIVELNEKISGTARLPALYQIAAEAKDGSCDAFDGLVEIARSTDTQVSGVAGELLKQVRNEFIPREAYVSVVHGHTQFFNEMIDLIDATDSDATMRLHYWKAMRYPLDNPDASSDTIKLLTIPFLMQKIDIRNDAALCYLSARILAEIADSHIDVDANTLSELSRAFSSNIILTGGQKAIEFELSETVHHALVNEEVPLIKHRREEILRTALDGMNMQTWPTEK